LIKVVFANPLKPGKCERVFADAGRGCEASEYVTAICEVTRGGPLRARTHEISLVLGGLVIAAIFLLGFWNDLGHLGAR